MHANASAGGLSRSDAAFLRRAMQAPLLARDEEQRLAEAWHRTRDAGALHRLVDSHTRLAAAVAARYRAYGLPLADLVQEGCLGLLQAAERFDPARGVRFSTYAGWWVRSAIQDYVLRNWSIVRSGTTSTQKTLFFNLRRLRARIERLTGRSLDHEGRSEIARTLAVPLKDVEAMEQRIGVPDQSLNAGFGSDDDGERQDHLGCERALPEAVVIGLADGRRRGRWLEEALAELTQRERIIIEQRRLLEQGKTLEDLGLVLGVSKERVRQLESRALGKLKTALARRVERAGDLLPEG